MIMDASPVGIVVFSGEAEVLFANPLAAELFARDSHALSGLRCGDFIGCRRRHTSPKGCGYSKTCPFCPLYQAICTVCSDETGSSPQEGETLLERGPDLPNIWIRFKVSGLNLDGRLVAVMAVEDISEHKTREEELQQALTELAVIHEHAPISMMLLDQERRVQKVNGFAARFAGRQAAEMIGLRGGEALRCLHHLDDPQGCGFGPACAECRVRRAVQDTFATGVSQHEVEAWLPFPRGEESREHCLLISTAYLNINDMERVLVCAQDVTERRQAEKTIRMHLKALESSIDGMAILDADENYVYLNQAHAEIYGYEGPVELLGSTWRILYTHNEAARFDREIFPLLRRQGHWRGEARGLKKDGSLFAQEISLTALEDGGLICVVRDISERKQNEQEQKKLQEQLTQAQKLESVGRLAGGVAHDFNNLLSIILGYGEMILQETAAEHPHREALQEIHEAALRAGELTRQLLAFSRKQVLEVKPVDLNTVLTGFDRLLRRVLGEDITLDLILDPEPLIVKADVPQLEQVLMNLAVNARDAMPDGGLLSIETGRCSLDASYAEQKPGVRPGTYAMLCITDTGCGMDTATLEHIFEPFFTTKAKDKGTGLGLAMIYGIIKQHEGNIWVYSEPGHGTSFKIYLPVASTSVPDAVPFEQQPEGQGGSARIMVVEDDPAVRKLTISILERSGYHVLDSDSAEGAVGLAAELSDPLHLVLSDVVMPDMKGPEVFAKIAEHHPESRVLYMSGYTDNVIARQGILQDGVPFIQKPFTVKALLQKVSSVLDSKSA